MKTIVLGVMTLLYSLAPVSPVAAAEPCLVQVWGYNQFVWLSSSCPEYRVDYVAMAILGNGGATIKDPGQVYGTHEATPQTGNLRFELPAQLDPGDILIFSWPDVARTVSVQCGFYGATQCRGAFMLPTNQ